MINELVNLLRGVHKELSAVETKIREKQSEINDLKIEATNVKKKAWGMGKHLSMTVKVIRAFEVTHWDWEDNQHVVPFEVGERIELTFDIESFDFIEQSYNDAFSLFRYRQQKENLKIIEIIGPDYRPVELDVEELFK